MDDPALSRFPKNFKAPSLSSYDGKSDPVEHITVFNTRMAVVGAADSLKCKLLAGTLCDASMWWYMNLPRFSIVGYQDMTRKLIQQFSTSRHHKVSSTSLFKIRQKENETSQDYLTRFNDATIKVSNPNQKLFVEAFQNGLRAGQFNESLAQKPADLMEEIMARAECCIKGEESNVEKKARDSKERGSNNSERRNYYPPANRDRGTFKKSYGRNVTPNHTNQNTLPPWRCTCNESSERFTTPSWSHNPTRHELTPWDSTEMLGAKTIEWKNNLLI